MTASTADTLHHAAPTPRQVPTARTWKKSTAQVLAELPDSATPWQQDSAVQAYFQPGQDIRYSEQPDTLGLPGQRVDARYAPVPADVWKDPAALQKWLSPDTPADSVLQTQASNPGMMADPLPYHPSADPLVGSLLSIKPVLYVPDRGTLDVVKKARGRKAALKAIIDGVLHDLSKIDPTGVRFHILHADCLADAEHVRDAIRQAYPQVGEITLTSLGVVIGAHCGPGLLTVFYLCGGRQPE